MVCDGRCHVTACGVSVTASNGTRAAAADCGSRGELAADPHLLTNCPAEHTVMAGLPPFEVESTTAGTIAVADDDSFLDSVTAISMLLILAYLTRATFPTFFTSLLDDNMLSAIGVSTPNSKQKSRAEDEDEWWHFPVHLLALWQMRHTPHQQACARRLVCDHVTAGRPDPFFDFAIGGVAYMMGASGSLSMVDKLQSLKEGPVDCERLVPECETVKLREAKGLGTTIQKLTDMLYDWMGW